jgi:hypothetical protein
MEVGKEDVALYSWVFYRRRSAMMVLMHVCVHTTLAAWNCHRYDVDYTPSAGVDLQNLLNMNENI